MRPRTIQTSLRYTSVSIWRRMGSSRQCHPHLVCVQFGGEMVTCRYVSSSFLLASTTLTRDAMAMQMAEGEPVVDIASASAAEEAAPAAADRVVSSNAYMLVYRRCGWSSSPGSGPVQLPERCLQHICCSAV